MAGAIELSVRAATATRELGRRCGKNPGNALAHEGETQQQMENDCFHYACLLYLRQDGVSTFNLRDRSHVSALTLAQSAHPLYASGECFPCTPCTEKPWCSREVWLERQEA